MHVIILSIASFSWFINYKINREVTHFLNLLNDIPFTGVYSR